MLATDSESQVEAVAERANGDVTVAPFAGLLTLIVLELLEPLVCAVTVMATSVSQETPLPHALTCSVCLPVEAVTVARTAALSTTVVSELLSSE